MKQALDLLHRWSPMDVVDALELLTPAFAHPAVRKYAVTRLRHADDEELLLYLLQLVQALKYENFDEIHVAHEREKEALQQQSLLRADSTSSSENDRYCCRESAGKGA